MKITQQNINLIEYRVTLEINIFVKISSHLENDSIMSNCVDNFNLRSVTPGWFLEDENCYRLSSPSLWFNFHLRKLVTLSILTHILEGGLFPDSALNVYNVPENLRSLGGPFCLELARKQGANKIQLYFQELYSHIKTFTLLHLLAEDALHRLFI